MSEVSFCDGCVEKQKEACSANFVKAAVMLLAFEAESSASPHTTLEVSNREVELIGRIGEVTQEAATERRTEQVMERLEERQAKIGCRFDIEELAEITSRYAEILVEERPGAVKGIAAVGIRKAQDQQGPLN